MKIIDRRTKVGRYVSVTIGLLIIFVFQKWWAELLALSFAILVGAYVLKRSATPSTSAETRDEKRDRDDAVWWAHNTNRSLRRIKRKDNNEY